MMSNTEIASKIRLKVGIFSLLALLLVGALTVFVNDKPFWWRPCQLVHINVADATGLKSKSPIRSLGLQIGYLKSVELFETHVRLGICITAQVDVMPSTRAYIRGEGFLGDKFVELKPVRYTGEQTPISPTTHEPKNIPKTNSSDENEKQSFFNQSLYLISNFFIASAQAEDSDQPERSKQKNKSSREIPIGERGQDMDHLVQQVDSLVNEMTKLTNNLREALNPQELRQTMQQLSKTLENASKTLSPEGGLNTTAQRTLAKLEDAIEQLRSQMTRVNKGEGSIGMLLNDPSYATELKEAIKNINRLLSKVSGVQFFVDLGGEQIPAHNGGRGWFRLGIWPTPTRYYLLGVTVDPRGSQKVVTTTTETGGVETVKKETQIEQSGLLVTAMLGKVLLSRFDFAAGVLHGDAAISTTIRLGPTDHELLLTLKNDLYVRGQGLGLEDRVTLQLRPFIYSSTFNSFYLTAGLESISKINGKSAFSYGGGITFNDEDIKLLFALR